MEELLHLPLSVGMFHQDWKIAQNICLRVADHPNANVRANAVMGLVHTARTKGKLEKRLVKPVVLKELREKACGERGEKCLKNRNFNWINGSLSG
ncbi:hypothetical protein P9222_10515 [Paenibacillus amylolyticus]|nr:hypothetical protein [Paenibacillus amylolyticus]WFR64522.1 hypothetical protein P9222_10515 [Paenibacillus amylolyticus]